MGTYILVEPRNASAEVSGSTTLVEVSSGSIIVEAGGSVSSRTFQVADWVNDTGTEYVATFTQASHGKGLSTLFQVHRSVSGRWICCTEEFDAGQNATSGDITVRVRDSASRAVIRVVVL